TPSEANASAGGTTGGTGAGGATNDAAPTAAPATTGEEADNGKQNGNPPYVASSLGKMFFYDLSDAAPPPRGRRGSPEIYVQEMFVSGFKVVLIGQPNASDGASSGVAPAMPVYYEPSTRVVVYDATSAASPEITGRFDFKGSYIDSRKVGNSVYLA